MRRFSKSDRPIEEKARREALEESKSDAYVVLHRRLAEGLKEQRRLKNWTQADLARSMKSSQSRVAKMEAGDTSVSLDLLFRSLIEIGTSNRDLAKIISGS